ncbi:hypothetical protein [Nostoc sp. CHAB 5715]|nr:hypothetical protein [Nostoc sp. CHAB 5715]
MFALLVMIPIVIAPHTPVAHGGNPHRPWRLPLGEDRAGSP